MKNYQISAKSRMIINEEEGLNPLEINEPIF